MPGEIITREEARRRFYSLPKYEREFVTVEEAVARRTMILDRWHPDGYSTSANIYQIDAARWLLLAWWADSCE